MGELQPDIGHYRIVAKLGEGGMGVVWRATDTKLNREVAIKLLPAAFAHDPAKLARFVREAQMLAALNHPHIAHIYGVEASALVMELVEGPTLAERIAQGAIPLEEALPLAVQIADGLEYAHEKGIVHRDLKPANIKLTPEGRVKILDFGLAKAMGGDAGSASSPEALTLSSPATLVGTVLGTAPYMSPEQARGKAVDRRADVWAFGAVLYEMLTGRRAFMGEDMADTLAAVVRSEPDLEPVPAAVRGVIERCLRKDPRRRLGCMSDLRLALEEPPPAAPAPALAMAPSPVRARWLGAALALALTAAAALAFLYFGRHAAPAPTARFLLAPPPGAGFAGDTPAISPDGSAIVFGGNDAKGVEHLWLRRLGQLDPQPLAGTEGATQAFWRPDGSDIGFAMSGGLYRMELNGSPPVRLADAINLRGASWGSNGVILYTPDVRVPVMQIPDAGGTPAPATTLDAVHGDVSDRWPWFLPDGRHFLYVSGPSISGDIYVGELGSTLRKRLGQANSGAEFAAGRLLYLNGSTLMAQAFDPRSLSLGGEIEPAAAPVQGRAGTLAGFFSASQTGELAYLPGVDLNSQLVWLDSLGHRTVVPGSAGTQYDLALSPDGTRLGYGLSTDVWIFDLARGVRSRFTFSGNARMGVWSPDGTQLAYRAGNAAYRKPADNSSPEQLLADGPFVPDSWSPDGKFLAMNDADGVWILPLAAKSKPAMLIPRAGTAVFSPDGRWLAYGSSKSGQPEVYLTSFAHAGGKYQVSATEGYMPVWGKNGQELYYVTPRGDLMGAPISYRGDAAEVGKIVTVFSGVDLSTSGTAYAFDARRGRLLIRVSDNSSTQQPLTVVLNWPSALGH